MPSGGERAILVLVVGLGVVGLVSLGRFNVLPAHVLLDVALYAVAVTLLGWIDRRMVPLIVVVGAVLVARIAYSTLGTDASLGDTIQAHKWLLNLAVLLLCSGRVARMPELAARLAWVLVPLALAKYTLEVLVLGHDRPGLLYENNFELAFLCGLVIVALRDMERGRLPLLAMLGAATVLSASRSGAIAFGVTALFAVHTLIGAKAVRLYVAAVTGAIAVVAAAMVFAARYAAEGQVDRLNFAHIFGVETAGRGFLGWMVGPAPMTTLSTDSCDRLGYYDVLISNTQTDQCYSVVLHAFVLRALFDFGVAGLIAAFAIPVYVMRLNGVSWPVVAALTAIAATNSASVSGMNNAFIVMPMALAIIAANARPQPPREGAARGATAPWRRASSAAPSIPLTTDG